MAKARSPQHLAYGNALRSFRLAAGLSQEALAARASLDRTYVSGIERGERNPSLANLIRLCDALGIALSELALRAEQLLTRRRSR